MSLALRRARKRAWLQQREYRRLHAKAREIVQAALDQQQAELRESYQSLAALVQARDGLLVEHMPEVTLQ